MGTFSTLLFEHIRSLLLETDRVTYIGITNI